ncbi:hypothetical protein CI109_106043 [Kwoniella shandongensis]|uniref:Uncharacterized protein n=1 Tax=Kwoniella shandongensis TaxID=1734106 RepID=A0AAJ8LPB5_9TREE
MSQETKLKGRPSTRQGVVREDQRLLLLFILWESILSQSPTASMISASSSDLSLTPSGLRPIFQPFIPAGRSRLTLQYDHGSSAGDTDSIFSVPLPSSGLISPVSSEDGSAIGADGVGHLAVADDHLHDADDHLLPSFSSSDEDESATDEDESATDEDTDSVSLMSTSSYHDEFDIDENSAERDQYRQHVIVRYEPSETYTRRIHVEPLPFFPPVPYSGETTTAIITHPSASIDTGSTDAYTVGSTATNATETAGSNALPGLSFSFPMTESQIRSEKGRHFHHMFNRPFDSKVLSKIHVNPKVIQDRTERFANRVCRGLDLVLPRGRTIVDRPDGTVETHGICTLSFHPRLESVHQGVDTAIGSR